MDKQQLQTSLTQLHQELATLDNVDDSTKTMLATIAADIAKLVDADSHDDDTSTGSENVRELVTEFEAEHPKLAQALGQLADGLANLGI